MILFRPVNFNTFSGLLWGLAIPLVFMGRPVYAQQPDAVLEQRITALENYVSKFQPALVELSETMNRSIQEYTQGLETSLQDYSRKLQMNLDGRLQGLDGKTIVLDPYSKGYQSIATNTGHFLIAVDRVEPMDNGMRVYLHIGNPNFADYQNFKLKLIWGSRWAGEQVMPYDQWRQTLNGAEYTFQGKIEKGKWNEMAADLTPVQGNQISYLECEMEVASVELEVN